MKPSILEFYLGLCLLYVRKAVPSLISTELKVYRTLWSVDLVHVRSLCWSSGGGGHYCCQEVPLSITLVRKAPTEYSGAELGVSSSSLHCVYSAVPWILSVLMGGFKNGLGQLFSLERGVCSSHYSGSPQRRPNNISSFSQASVISQHSSVCIWIIFLPSGTTLLCFISGMWLSFKNPNFRDAVPCGPALSSGGGSCWAVAGTSYSQKSTHMTVQGLGFYGKASQKAVIQVNFPQQPSLPVC